MSTEIDAVGLGSASGLSSGLKADLSGQPCHNCGAPVDERHCPKCGQLAASFHRPILTLIGEIIGDLTSLDGRLARTLPRLLLRPGALTRDYIAGQRARYMPPFRLFLLVSVIFYLILFGLFERAGWLMQERLADPETGEISIQVQGSNEVLIDRDGRIDRDLARRALLEGDDPPEDAEAAAIFIDRVANVIENRDLFVAQLQQWLPRLSLLVLPVTIVALVLLHFWRRDLYVYDHAIHALHLQSWLFLTGSAVLLLGLMIGGAGWWLFSIALCAYVWRSLVVVGQTNAVMGTIRLFCLLVIWAVMSVVIVLAGMVISGLSL